MRCVCLGVVALTGSFSLEGSFREVSVEWNRIFLGENEFSTDEICFFVLGPSATRSVDGSSWHRVQPYEKKASGGPELGS